MMTIIMAMIVRMGGWERLYDNGIDRHARGCAPQPTPERELRSQFEFSRDGVGDHFPSSECHFASSELKFVNTGTWL